MSYEQNRKLALAALRSNHRGYQQIKGRLQRPGTNDRCATGIVAEAFHVPIRGQNDTKTNAAVEELLGDTGVVGHIISLNDGRSLSLSAIADNLEKRWGLQ